MTTEVQELLPRAMLDTSSQALGDSLQKGPTSPALGVSSSTREEGSKPVATSSQASLWVATPDITQPFIQPPKVAYAPITLPTKTLGADMGALPDDVLSLKEEMNSAMGCLLMTRTSIGAHQRKQVSDFETAIHQNEAEATEAIRQAKVCCGSAIRVAEACCAADIREAESCCAGHACTIQQSHSNNVQHLEREAIEEGKDHQFFLFACRVALEVCPPEA